MPIVPPIIHGSIIITGVAIVICGIVIAMTYKGKNKLMLHMSLEIIGASLSIIGAFLGMFLTYVHAVVAIVAIILLMMGIGGGLYYKSLKSSDTKIVEQKKIFRKVHIMGGRITDLVLIIVIVLGLLTVGGILLT
jgi:hypothetical protein